LVTGSWASDCDITEEEAAGCRLARRRNWRTGNFGKRSKLWEEQKKRAAHMGYGKRNKRQ